MNVKQAKVIKTNSDKETEMAKRTTNVLLSQGQEIVLVPYGVTGLYITIDNDELAIFLERTDNGFNPVELDRASGFNSVAECEEYARVVMKEAGLPEDCCDADVWEVDKEEMELWNGKIPIGTVFFR